MPGMILRAIWLAVALTGESASMRDPQPMTVRIPLNTSGDLDMGRVLDRLAEIAGVSLAKPDLSLTLPVHGLAGTLTRTLFKEALGPEVTLEIEPEALVFQLDASLLEADRLPQWKARLESLATRAEREAKRRLRYGLFALPSYQPNDPNRPTVCLIHGLNSTSGSFVHMVPLLEQAGFGVVVYDYPDNQDLDLSAPAFVRDWKAFRNRMQETRPWAVITHSMGGLLARYYVEGDDYDSDVSDLILIGPPNQGSAIAGVQTLLQLIEGVQAIKAQKTGNLRALSDGLGESADDLLPGSAFLKVLNHRPRRAGVRYHILAGDLGFLSSQARRDLESRLGLVSRGGGLFGNLTRLAISDLSRRLDELTEGQGDGCVSVASTRLEGVSDHVTIHANHVELIRGPLLYPEPGPVACMPFVLDRLKGSDQKPAERSTSRRSSLKNPPDID